MSDNSEQIAAAMACLDAFMAAFNARDVEAFEATFNFPSVRLASNALRIIERGDRLHARAARCHRARSHYSTTERTPRVDRSRPKRLSRDGVHGRRRRG